MHVSLIFLVRRSIQEPNSKHMLLNCPFQLILLCSLEEDPETYERIRICKNNTDHDPQRRLQDIIFSSHKLG
jgi:hypothetical protein